jgi:predicted dehydrogenase
MGGVSKYYHAAAMTHPVRLGRLFSALFVLVPLTAFGQPAVPAATPPVKLAIAGVAHGHIGRIVRLIKASSDVELVGVFDKDPALHALMVERYGLPRTLIFDDLDVMLDKTRPQAVAAFGTTADHPVVVEAAARRGIHVMMEKPLAISNADADRIRQAAAKGKVHVIVNYETTWYPSHAAIWKVMKERKAGGEIRKMVAMDGHEGPKEIGVGPEFFDWLTDPVRNGAGALFDFGCYGANLMTWLMDNQRPLTVTAITQRIKPDIYPRVDDEATILVEYPKAQGIIQASWNWPFGRKDLEVYGATGYAIATGGNSLRLRLPKETERAETPEPRTPTERDELAYFTAIVRGTTLPSGLSSLDNNLIVTEILDAARESARTGKTIQLAR